MARLLTMGFELGSAAGGGEIDIVNYGGGGVLSLVTGRTGGKAMRFAAPVSGGGPSASRQFLSATTAKDYYIRFYMRYSGTITSTETDIMNFSSTSNVSQIIATFFGGTMTVYSASGGANLVATTVMAQNTWYRVDIRVDCSSGTATYVEFKINGISQGIAGYSALSFNRIAFGNIGANSSSTIDIDDVAINDSTGSYQTTYAPDGRIIAMRPTANGEAFNWSYSGASAGWDAVDELPPSGTDYASSDVLGAVFWCAAGPTVVGQSINIVEVGCQFQGEHPTTSSSFRLRAQTQNAGTVTNAAYLGGASITTSTYFNAAAIPRNSPLVMHTDPTGTPWTNATLASLQIGAMSHPLIAADGVRVHAIWAMVEIGMDFAISGIGSITNISSISST